MNKISCISFYDEYHGHAYAHLKTIISHMKHKNLNIIFLAGDSSLDNKFWVKGSYRQALNGYEDILNNQLMIPDVSYHLNKQLSEAKINYCSINCAVEESTIADRKINLLPQDCFIKENISEEDILIVSIGGNDIALRPSIMTIWNLGLLVSVNSTYTLQNNPQNAWGINYFINTFKTDVENYIKNLIGDKKPKCIVPCMIYYPDQKMTGSWADKTLGYLGYNNDPSTIQTVIKQIFHLATSKIDIPGCKIIPIPMYEILDGSDTNDYVQRVEPSDIGGLKLAAAFIQKIFPDREI